MTDRDARLRNRRDDEVRHPGPPAAERHEARGFDPVAIRGRLRPGRTVRDEIVGLVEAAGCRSAVLAIGAGPAHPLHFIGPARSTDGIHAVWYREERRLGRGAMIEAGTAIVGTKDGQGFVHLHGAWRDGEDRFYGHLLCEKTRLGGDIEVLGHGGAGCGFDNRPDAETAFSIFALSGKDDADAHAFFLRLRPHCDILRTIEAACREREISTARIHGLGSLIGVRFDDGEALPGPATEVDIRSGFLENGRAVLDVRAVDVDGTVREGYLSRERNIVCVTFELMILAERGMSDPA